MFYVAACMEIKQQTVSRLALLAIEEERKKRGCIITKRK
jgi:hypothetical protein